MNNTNNAQTIGQSQGSNASQADLTNANSPLAAGFNGTKSITKLTPPSGSFNPTIGVRVVADGLTAPMTAASPNDGTGRLFIVDQVGTVRILYANGTFLKDPFLDISGKMVKLSPGYDERGLLGLAFDPDFKNNSRVFVYYSIPLRSSASKDWNHTNQLSEFTVSKNNPNKVDMDSEKMIMQVDLPYMNHNGGQIRFGPDGYLYIPTGDGGRADDTGIGHTPVIGNAQDLTKPLGKVLRIDVNNASGGKPYSIPSDNPFLSNKSIQPEIYAYGLRNPAFASFDASSGLMFVGNAGQELFESIYIIVKGGDYGWNIREGTHCFDPNKPAQPPANCRTTGYTGEQLIGPIVELGHDIGQTIVGGFVYRGKALPDFQGRYIFGDWSSYTPLDNGTLLVATPPSGWKWSMPATANSLTPSDVQMWPTEVIRVAGNSSDRIGAYVRGFGEDSDHEIYIMTSQNGGPSGATGKVYKIVPANAAM
ncbi:MAG: sorbosone dehydrogenase family protein [Methanotrichaceae archaeon]